MKPGQSIEQGQRLLSVALYACQKVGRPFYSNLKMMIGSCNKVKF